MKNHEPTFERAKFSAWRWIALTLRRRSGIVQDGTVVAENLTRTPLDVASVRARFPALAGGAAYFDGPAARRFRARCSTPSTPTSWGERQPGGAFASSARRPRVMERGRLAAADFTGGDPDGIAFGANMTTLNFLLAHAVARTLEPGDEVVVTQLDHDANGRPGCWWPTITTWSSATRRSAGRT